MANMDITEKRLPQDGKIKFRCYNGETIELRVATLPIGGLEDAMLRLLATGELLRLEDVHLDPLNYEHLLAMSEKPHGLILCVGPTGSGKTTTLHALIEQLKRPSLKIITIEDPSKSASPESASTGEPEDRARFRSRHALFPSLRPRHHHGRRDEDPETAKIGTEASLTGIWSSARSIPTTLRKRSSAFWIWARPLPFRRLPDRHRLAAPRKKPVPAMPRVLRPTEIEYRKILRHAERSSCPPNWA